MPDEPLKIRLSASQVKQFESCNRQWFYERVKRIEVKKSYAQGLGTEVHTHAENWLKHGTVPPDNKAGQILRAGLTFLPQPKTPGIMLEEKFEFDVTPQISVVGYMDLRMPGVGVRDFKTTGAIGPGGVFTYKLTPAQLLADIQGQLYAYVEGSGEQWRVKMPHQIVNGRDVDLDWIYFATKGAARADHTAVTMPFYEIEGRAMPGSAMKGIDRVLEAGKKIIPLKLAPDTDPNDVPGNYKNCDSYGGCPHRSYCPVRSKTFADLFGIDAEEKQDMGLKEKLKAKLEGSASGLAGEAAKASDTMLGDLKANAAIAASQEAKAAPSTPAPVASAAPAEGINPPDAAQSPDDLPEPAPTAEESAAPRRRRRTAAEMATARAAQEADASQYVSKVIDDQGERVVHSGTVAETLGLSVVYIDCFPVKAGTPPVLPAEVLLAKAAANVKQKTGLEDYRLADYGKGAPLLALEFGKLYDALPKPVSISVSSRTPEGGVVLSFLIDRADEVVRGV